MSYSLFHFVPKEYGFADSTSSSSATTSRNLIEFSKIYENLQQQQQQQSHRSSSGSLAIPNICRNYHQQQQPTQSASSSSSVSSLSMNSLSSQFNQMMLSSRLQSSSTATNHNNDDDGYQVIKVTDHKKLFVGNLPSNTRLCELLELFKKYGRVNEKLCVVKDQNYAFIHFYDENDAKLALDDVNDSLFKNRYIRVQYSTSQAHIKRSKTFDTSSDLVQLATAAPQVIQPPAQQPNATLRRAITGGNRLFYQQQQQLQHYLQLQRTLSFNSERDAYLAVMQQQPTTSSSRFFPAASSSMTKSSTFASFQN